MKKATYWFLNVIYFTVLFISYTFLAIFALFVVLQTILIVKEHIIFILIIPALFLFSILFKYRNNFLDFINTFK